MNEEKGITDISFSIYEGEIHGLIGLNGAGKTTIIKTILNQLQIDSGSILWKGVTPVQNGKSFDYRKQIGYVPDDEVLLENLTPNEIVSFAGYTYGMTKEKIASNAKALFELLQLQEVNANVNGFSRGMRKKVQVATALLANPELLVLDEPIAGFDPNVIYTLKQLLLQLKQKGTSILISTHDLNMANQLCDRITLIHQGKVVVSDVVSELLPKHQCASVEELFVSHTLHSSSKERIQHVVSHL